MGNQYNIGLGYADDLPPIVPSLNGLQSLIHSCEDYADEHDVLFNGSKSQFMIFNVFYYHMKNCFIIVNNVPLMNTDKAVHLGHSLSTYDNHSFISVVVNEYR